MAAVPRAAPLARRLPRLQPMRADATYARPGGCAFAPRCSQRQPDCARAAPALQALADDHRVACHHAQAPRGVAESTVS
jgi:peptide/nickel transport system ATP-binding protein